MKKIKTYPFIVIIFASISFNSCTEDELKTSEKVEEHQTF